jgi:hypothetical protein
LRRVPRRRRKRALRETTDVARTAVQDFVSPDGMGPQMSLTIRNTLSSIEEVTQDLAESTEALKRHFLFRGFFQDRGFFDLDTISREAYQEGLLERDHRTAVRIWLDAAVLFERDRDGVERLTPDGRGRIDSAMSQLVQHPRDSSLVIEGYAETTSQDTAFLASNDRARLVRDYVLARFQRQTTLRCHAPQRSGGRQSQRQRPVVRGGPGALRPQRHAGRARGVTAAADRQRQPAIADYG